MTDISFEDLVDIDKWPNLDKFIAENGPILEEDISKRIEWRRKLKENLSKDKELKKKIFTVSEEKLGWAKKQLTESNVCAVDGTVAQCSMISGAFTRIGIVATSYKNDRIDKVFFISDRKLAEPAKDPLDYIKNLKSVGNFSGMLARGIMYFCERRFILNKRKEEWKIVHGELFPFELQTGLGRFRVLGETLKLAEDIVKNKKVIGVIEGTKKIDIISAGDILEKKQYMKVRDWGIDLDKYLNGDEETGTKAHFNSTDQERFKKFIDQFGKEIWVGMFRVGLKPYMFHAHKDFFHEAAAILIQDGSYQAIRGFPLLVDYADQVCSSLLSGKDFEKQILFKMAKKAGEDLFFDINPRLTRRR